MAVLHPRCRCQPWGTAVPHLCHQISFTRWPDRRKNRLLLPVLLGATFVGSVLGSPVSLWACGVHSFSLLGAILWRACHLFVLSLFCGHLCFQFGAAVGPDGHSICTWRDLCFHSSGRGPRRRPALSCGAEVCSTFADNASVFQ